MNFTKWTKPGTKLARVYVNGFSDATVYVVDGSTTGNFSAGYPETVVRGRCGDRLSQERIDQIMDIIDMRVQELRPSDKAPTFADYLAVADGR